MCLAWSLALGHPFGFTTAQNYSLLAAQHYHITAAAYPHCLMLSQEKAIDSVESPQLPNYLLK